MMHIHLHACVCMMHIHLHVCVCMMHIHIHVCVCAYVHRSSTLNTLTRMCMRIHTNLHVSTVPDSEFAQYIHQCIQTYMCPHADLSRLARLGFRLEEQQGNGEFVGDEFARQFARGAAAASGVWVHSVSRVSDRQKF